MKILNKDSLWIFALTLICFLSFFLRFETAVNRPLWPDEKITLSSASLPTVSELYKFSITKYRGDTPFLYPLLCWMIAGNFSPEWTVRLFSLISGVISCVLLAQLASSILSKRIGFYAASLFSFCSYHIEYSQDGRSYSFFTFLLITEFIFLISYLKNNNKRDLLGFIIACTCSLYTHNCSTIFLLSGFLMVALHYLIIIFPRCNYEECKSLIIPMALSYILIMALYIPGLINYLTFVQQYAAGEAHVLNFSLNFIYELFGRWGNGTDWSWVYFTLFILGCLNLIKKEFGFMILIWFISPFLVFTLIPFNKSFFDIRYLFGSLPAFFLIIASGISLFVDLIFKVVKYCIFVSKRQTTANKIRLCTTYAEVLVFSILICLSISTYLKFRLNKQKCSMFAYQPQVMTDNNGFCKKHIILNSLYEEHRFIFN